MSKAKSTTKTKKKKRSLDPSFDQDLANVFNFSEAQFIVGLDEVGRGCLAGPVFSGAFIYDLKQQEKIASQVAETRIIDSKMLDAEERAAGEKALHALIGLAEFSVEEASVEEIDRFNIHHASLLAMHRAFDSALQKASVPPESRLLILVDGSFVPKQIQQRIEYRNGLWRMQSLTKGDSRSFAIAAAAILAKEARDRFMRKLSLAYPLYLWEKNAGYATPEHKAALYQHGETSWHRKSFQWRKSEEQISMELL